MKVGVLYGGWSGERAISLKSGRAVLAALKRLRIPHVGIDVTPRVARDLERCKIGLAFLAVHGPFGEDGTLQGLLEILKIPYTGSGVLASATAMHKPTTKRIFESAGLPTPGWFTVKKGAKAPPPSFEKPWVVKPASQGSALGVSIVRRRAQWGAALRAAWKLEPEALVERYVPGTEITVGILGGRALPVVEIVPVHGFYDFHSKYAAGGSRHLIPARLPGRVLEEASRISLRAFEALGCRQFGRVDLMVPRSGRPTLLEVNTLPGMTDKSLLPDAAGFAGLDFDGLVLEILHLAGFKGRKP